MGSRAGHAWRRRAAADPNEKSDGKIIHKVELALANVERGCLNDPEIWTGARTRNDAWCVIRSRFREKSREILWVVLCTDLAALTLAICGDNIAELSGILLQYGHEKIIA